MRVILPRLAVVTAILLMSLGDATPRAFAYPDYLQNREYAVYKGAWRQLPNLESLAPMKGPGPEAIDLSALDKTETYASRLVAALVVPVDGNYLLRHKAGDSSIVLLDGNRVIASDGGDGRRPKIVEDLIYLKSGIHSVSVYHLLRPDRPRVAEFTVEGPDLYKVDRLHWLYFGWEFDHPKSLSFMGGTVMPGRDQRIQYAIEVGGTTYVPDEFTMNRRDSIRWYLAGDYLPSPVSEWKAGLITVRIQHFANRVAGDSATAVYTRVGLTNSGRAQEEVTVHVNAGPDLEVPLSHKPHSANGYFSQYKATIAPSQTISLDFVACASGDVSPEALLAAGGFDANFSAMSGFYDGRLDTMTHPESLPEQNWVSLYKAAQIAIWESIVHADNGDVELRGSGGNPAGFYSYDRTFSHDVPNMVDQLIRGGDDRLAKQIMESGYYQRLGRELEQNYLDAVPKYIIPYATYLQFSGDSGYFTPQLREKIRASARALAGYRDRAVLGPYSGIMQKSGTLDNPPYYLLVDNFAALHGLAAYRYLCAALGETTEVRWAQEEMLDLNRCLNSALSASMQRRGVDWYMSTFDDESYFWKNGYDGNWIGTSLMMSTFPWDASLTGFDLGGTWREAFDASIDNAQRLRNVSPYGIPERSWGAWWGHEYGTCYNAGMGLQLLFSEKHRTEVVANIQFLQENQSAPFQWGESFDRAASERDWTIPAADYETWGLSYTQQAMLESCVSVRADGTIIVGRGIPDSWLKDGEVISWKNVRIGNGRKADFLIAIQGRSVVLKITGDTPLNDIVFDLPSFADSIAGVEVDGARKDIKANASGGIRMAAGTKVATVLLKRIDIR